jgi:hypothetical protein
MIHTDTSTLSVTEHFGEYRLIARVATAAERRQLGALDNTCAVLRVEGPTGQLLDVVALEGTAIGGRPPKKELDALVEAIMGPAEHGVNGVRPGALQWAARELVEHVIVRYVADFQLAC